MGVYSYEVLEMEPGLFEVKIFGYDGDQWVFHHSFTRRGVLVEVDDYAEAVIDELCRIDHVLQAMVNK